MPYTIERRRGQFCVIKLDDGQIMGCHATQEEAQAQLTAIRISESESRFEVREQ